MEFATAPELLAACRGKLSRGPHRCFYCGAACGEQYTARQYVADSFTERDCVAAPGSSFVCAGCMESLRSDIGSVPLIDGTEYRTKEGGKRKPRPGAAGSIQFRWFSWVLTADRVVGATPGHRELLRQLCLDPPEPPFAICIADGNKHQLFRTPINLTTGRIALNCEGTRVDYAPEELDERMHLTTRLVAACGKGASSISRLMDPASDVSVALQLGRKYPDAGELLEAWRAVRNQPLSDLAMWLTPGGEDARNTLAATA